MGGYSLPEEDLKFLIALRLQSLPRIICRDFSKQPGKTGASGARRGSSGSFVYPLNLSPPHGSIKWKSLPPGVAIRRRSAAPA